MNAKRNITIAAIVVTGLSLTFCKREKAEYTVSDSAMVPSLPDEVYDYPVSSNDYLATLGRVLFYDKELSANKNIACGSCHKQEMAFTDNMQFSEGTHKQHTDRNTPSVFPKNGRLFWDGRSNSLQDLIFRPIRNKVEMDVSDINSLMDRIGSLDYYNHLFKHAFPNMKKIDSNMVKTAMSEFLRNFNFSNTKFARAQKNQETLTASEKTGKDIFFGNTAKCSQCHHIDASIAPPSGGGGNGYGVTNESHNIGLDPYNKDLGVGGVTKNKSEEGAFMMPVLLNVEFTAPYMHDGRFKTLEEVVEHYNSKIESNPNLDFILRDQMNHSQPMRLNLSEAQKKGLVDFLKTLTDERILHDPMYSDPFESRKN